MKQFLNKVLQTIILLTGFVLHLAGQIPVECLAGHQKATADIMFFRYFLKNDKSPSHCLFFNRNRASVDYRITSREYLPQFGFTEALSWNHPRLKGFAPVAVLQILNTGVYPKAGVQYVLLKKSWTVFTWAVCRTDAPEKADHFLLLRFTPRISEHIHLFEQAESLLALDFGKQGSQALTLRFRSGVSYRQWQAGAGADLFLFGSGWTSTSTNAGIFLRHEF
ncbi:MAG: hypothetical protein Fur0041_18130 [Bacteroidia bacterium]